MSDFTPVDHKESDPEYVALVRKSVAQRLDTTLQDIDDPAFIIGRWRSSISRQQTHDYDLEHMPDGTIADPGGTSDEHSSKWKIGNDTYEVTSWCPPMPEYGMDTGSWTGEAYRCARTEDGRFVYWNGDGSLIVTLTKTTK